MKKFIIGTVLTILLVAAPAMAEPDDDWVPPGHRYEGGNASAEATAVGVGVGIGVGMSNVDVENEIDNNNYNSNRNSVRNYNSDYNYNDVDVDVDQKQKQQQGQMQGQLQGQMQEQTAHNEGVEQHVTIVNEDKREHVVAPAPNVGPTADAPNFASDADDYPLSVMDDIMMSYNFTNGNWHNMSIDGDYKTNVVSPNPKTVDVDMDAKLEYGRAKTFVGMVSVTADDDNTNSLQVMAEAMRLAARMGGTHVTVVDMDIEIVNTTDGWTIGFNTVGSGTGDNSSASVGGGPGYSKAEAKKQIRPFVTVKVTK